MIVYSNIIAPLNTFRMNFADDICSANKRETHKTREREKIERNFTEKRDTVHRTCVLAISLRRLSEILALFDALALISLHSHECERQRTWYKQQKYLYSRKCALHFLTPLKYVCQLHRRRRRRRVPPHLNGLFAFGFHSNGWFLASDACRYAKWRGNPLEWNVKYVAIRCHLNGQKWVFCSDIMRLKWRSNRQHVLLRSSLYIDSLCNFSLQSLPFRAHSIYGILRVAENDFDWISLTYKDTTSQ